MRARRDSVHILVVPRRVGKMNIRPRHSDKDPRRKVLAFDSPAMLSARHWLTVQHRIAVFLVLFAIQHRAIVEQLQSVLAVVLLAELAD